MDLKDKTELILMVSALEKLVENDQSFDEVKSILLALQKVNMTLDLLRETKIGILVNKCKKKYSTNVSIGDLSKSLIYEWKKLTEPVIPTTSTATTVSSVTSSIIVSEEGNITRKKQTTSTVSSSSSSSTSSSSSSSSFSLLKQDDSSNTSSESPRYNNIDSNSGSITPSLTASDDTEYDQQYETLIKSRKQIVDIFTELFLDSTNQNKYIARFLSMNIERSLFEAFPWDPYRSGSGSADSNKAYMTKFRALSYNLKRNEQLRKDIADGSCPAGVLVHLTPAQLATDEVKSERAAALVEGALERRSDIYQLMRGKIQESVGIDPNVDGAFTCKKCKQSKTTNYPMQTRSADEPMTIFVCCLSCGYRWRCT